MRFVRKSSREPVTCFSRASHLFPGYRLEKAARTIERGGEHGALEAIPDSGREARRGGQSIAGERLWEIVQSGDPAAALTIRSTRWAADSVDCVFDVSTGSLTCAPGAAIAAPALTFQVLPSGIIRRGGMECTIDEAVNLVLDELVWKEEAEGVES